MTKADHRPTYLQYSIVGSSSWRSDIPFTLERVRRGKREKGGTGRGRVREEGSILLSQDAIVGVGGGKTNK